MTAVPHSGFKALKTTLGEWRGRVLRLLPGFLFNRNVKTTREGFVFIGLIIAVGIAAINTGNNLLFMIMALLFSTMLASFSLSEYSISQVELERRFPGHAQAGAQFLATYRLINRKKIMPSVNILIQDWIEKEPVRVLIGQVAGRSSWRGKSRAVEEVNIPVRINRRGRVRWSRVTMSTLYPFGFFRKSKEVVFPGELVVYPAVEQISHDEQQPHSYQGQIKQRHKGLGHELFGFREYRRGDSLRWVHWKTSARAGQLMVREFEREMERSLCLELSVSGPRPAKDEPFREISVRRAASLAAHYINDGYRVRVETQGRGVDYGIGMDHLYRILHFLALFDDPADPAKGEKLRPEENIAGYKKIII